MGFAAYLYMREQLGINVTFYPTLDYDDIWSGEHWDDWATLAYPRKYFEWLADDEGDSQFEIWQTQMMRTDANGDETFNGESEFILKGVVDFGGFVGAYGEESVWVPSYVLVDEPDFFIPAVLRENHEYRERLMNAASGYYGANGTAEGTDFVKRTEERCNAEKATNYISLGSYAFFFCILIALTYYSWGTRRALAVFKESTCAYFSSFLSLLCTLITATFYMVTDDPAFRIAVQSACITLVIGAVFFLFYATRIYAFYAQPENRNVTDARGASHASTPSVSSVSQASSVMKPGPAAAQS